MMKNESYFLRHEPCPNCNSRDNLAVWSDGHKYCFGCGYIENGKGESIAVKLGRALKEHREGKQSVVTLPGDLSFNIPVEVTNWLKQYYITKQHIAQYNIRWSEERKSLIFPIYEVEKLLYYQERNFAGRKPKYRTYGDLNGHLPVFGDDRNAAMVVVVEDYLSAIRVAEKVPCMPLFGSHLNKTVASRLATQYHYLGIWLDHDKYSEAIQFHKKYSYLFDCCTVIHTHKDPKAHTPEEIFENVWGNFDMEVENA